jgi:hypothetical protein
VITASYQIVGFEAHRQHKLEDLQEFIVAPLRQVAEEDALCALEQRLGQRVVGAVLLDELEEHRSKVRGGRTQHSIGDQRQHQREQMHQTEEILQRLLLAVRERGHQTGHQCGWRHGTRGSLCTLVAAFRFRSRLQRSAREQQRGLH